MRVDCGRCAMRGTGCRDCVVAVLIPPDGGFGGFGGFGDYLDEAEVRALGVLAHAGLVPPLRLSETGSQLRAGERSWIFPETKAS
jgi:hypothetical protein